jgi:Major Facilitator Superfamily
VNLWGYTQLEAALAIVPVPLCGLLAWPFVGRAADTRPPGELAKPALIVMAVGMLWVSFLPATSDDAWAYIRILPGLLMIGFGMGIGFPALNVGAMGAVTGQDLGLASGVLNTARQLGAAIGVAILIATFGGALHAHMSWFAEDEIDDIVGEWEIPRAEAATVIQGTLHDYTGGTSDRFEPKPGFDEEIIRETAGSAREGFAWAFRQAALLVLSVLPLMGALKRTPAQAQAEFMERMNAQQGAGGGGPPGTPASGGNGGDRPDGDGVEPDGDGAPARPATRPGPEPRPA